MTDQNRTGGVLEPALLEQEIGLRLDPKRHSAILQETPPKLRPISHYAVLWGSSGDGYRSQLIAGVTERARRNLKAVVGLFEDELDEWLAGAEASSLEPDDAYVAFSAMRMAADEII